MSEFFKRAALCAAMLLFSAWSWAQPVLSITSITWNVIGLDSNRPATDGPEIFPVGARVCNTGTQPAVNLRSSFAFIAGSTAINLIGASSIVHGTLTTGAVPPSQYTIATTPVNCADFYYNVRITRSAASFDQTRSFQITALADNAVSVTTPANRELYVERLVSQNRNSIVTISGPTDVFVGDTYNFTYNTSSAPGGYEQLENFINWPNTIFQVLSVSTSYSQPAGGVNSTPYADGCGWQNNPAIPATYRSCVGPTNYTSGRAGGNTINTTYTIRVLSPATTSVTGLVHDFSGSSYHYNSDFGAVTLNVTARNRQADLAITKTNSQTSLVQNSTTSYRIVVTNAGPDGAVTTTVSDPAVSGLVKTSVTCVASAGTACPVTLTVAALEGTGLVIVSTSVNSTLTLTLVATVTASAGTVTNVATVSPNINVIDSVSANNTATDADMVIGLVNLTIAKTNGVGTLSAGTTTSYTITVSNFGPAAANNAVVADSVGTGLNCTSVRCTAPSGGATCPVALPLDTTVNTNSTTFTGSGELIPSFPANSSITFSLLCSISATGQ